MGISQKKLKECVAYHSDIRDYFNKKSLGSDNWIIDACIEYNEIFQQVGGNQLMANVAKTTICLLAGLAVGGAIGSGFMWLVADSPLLGGAVFGAIGMATSIKEELERPAVKNWKPGHTKTITELKQRARHYKLAEQNTI